MRRQPWILAAKKSLCLWLWQLGHGLYRYGRSVFLRLGLAIRADADSHMQATEAALVTPDDVVIAVSHSGATKELLQSVQTAKAAGAGIIVITSHGQSLLAKLADICLCGMAAKSSTCRKPVPRG